MQAHHASRWAADGRKRPGQRHTAAASAASACRGRAASAGCAGSAGSSATRDGGGAQCLGRAAAADDSGHGPVTPSGDAVHPQQLCVPTDGAPAPARAAAADGGSEMCDAGGCIAAALVALGVFETEEEAKAVLNEAGARVFSFHRRENPRGGLVLASTRARRCTRRTSRGRRQSSNRLCRWSASG